MGLFSHSEWVTTDKPYILRVYIRNGSTFDKHTLHEYGDKDDIYHIPSTVAAHGDAEIIRREGTSKGNTHYPANSIEKVEVIPGKWILVEAT